MSTLNRDYPESTTMLKVPLGEAPEPAQPATDGADIDLVAWGRGEADYPFSIVQKAIDGIILHELSEWIRIVFGPAAEPGDDAIDRWLKDRIMPTDPSHALQFLIEEGIIDADEARTDV